MIRLKRKPTDGYPEDVCAAYHCEEPSAMTLGAGTFRPFPVPLCDKHNDKRCKEDEAKLANELLEKARCWDGAQDADPQQGATPDSDQQEPKLTKEEREAAWRAKVKAEQAAKPPKPKPPRKRPAAAEPQEAPQAPPDPPPEELPAPPELEAFINAPLLDDQPPPKPKRKRKPKAKAADATDPPAADPKPEAKPKSKRKPRQQAAADPKANGNGGPPLGALKRALIGAGVAAVEVVNLDRSAIDAWMAEHLPAGDRDRVLENARSGGRAPRTRPRTA